MAGMSCQRRIQKQILLWLTIYIWTVMGRDGLEGLAEMEIGTSPKWQLFWHGQCVPKGLFPCDIALWLYKNNYLLARNKTGSVIVPLSLPNNDPWLLEAQLTPPVSISCRMSSVIVCLNILQQNDGMLRCSIQISAPNSSPISKAWWPVTGSLTPSSVDLSQYIFSLHQQECSRLLA